MGRELVSKLAISEAVGVLPAAIVKPVGLAMKWIIATLVVIFLALQYRLWVGPGSMAEVNRLQQAIDVQKTENKKTSERNAALDAEVKDLKQGVEAIEERARSELGMIKQDETFYQIINE